MSTTALAAVPTAPPPPYDSHPCNVVIFGETGAGKSSLVNLIAGYELARTSSDAGACTFTSNPYHVVFESNRPFCIWDTIGLNEPEIPREDYLRAIKQAYELVKELERLGGVHLLLFCVRGRLTKSVQQNYKLFVNILCEKKVPLGVVVTHLENERCMEAWWTANKGAFQKYGISADGHACITASPGAENVFLDKYEESRERMHKLLLELTLSAGRGWRRESREWFVRVMGRMRRMLSLQRGRPSQVTRPQLTERLIRECGFPRRAAKSIAASIIEIRDQNEA